MRDGERFFAEGRDNANYELTQQQMRRPPAGGMGLRQQILAGLATLGRDVQIIQQLGQAYPERLSLVRSGTISSGLFASGTGWRRLSSRGALWRRTAAAAASAAEAAGAAAASTTITATCREHYVTIGVAGTVTPAAT